MARQRPAAAQLSAQDIDRVRGMVIFEDDQIIAFNKPAGLSSQGGRIAAHTLDDLLWVFARPGHARPRLIHRLDRDTSGVILTARTAPAAAALGRAMMARRMKKTYLAIVAPGAPAPREGRIVTALRRESIGSQAYVRTCEAKDPGAMAASTGYRTLGACEAAALVELSPRTGRMHQLRVHMASIGRPIAGDARYGGTLVLTGAPVARMMLHAAALAFVHPSGEPLILAAPLPDDMAQALHSLGMAAPAARNARQADPF